MFFNKIVNACPFFIPDLDCPRAVFDKLNIFAPSIIIVCHQGMKLSP